VSFRKGLTAGEKCPALEHDRRRVRGEKTAKRKNSFSTASASGRRVPPGGHGTPRLHCKGDFCFCLPTRAGGAAVGGHPAPGCSAGGKMAVGGPNAPRHQPNPPQNALARAKVSRPREKGCSTTELNAINASKETRRHPPSQTLLCAEKTFIQRSGPR